MDHLSTRSNYSSRPHAALQHQIRINWYWFILHCLETRSAVRMGNRVMVILHCNVELSANIPMTVDSCEFCCTRKLSIFSHFALLPNALNLN